MAINNLGILFGSDLLYTGLIGRRPLPSMI